MALSFAIHVLGVVFWTGGLLFGTKLIKLAGDDSAVVRTLAKKTAFAYILPGFVIVLLSGLHQLFAGGIGVYMKQGWMHAKLTLVALLIWSTFSVFLSLRALSQGEKVSSKVGSLHHAVVAAALLLGLILVYVRPF
jgi:putative membrane protein